ncbi:MAG: hypothetical protein ACM3UQ_00115 [Clostridiales bacterium]
MAVLVGIVVWFFMLYGIAIQGTDKKIGISEPSQNGTARIAPDYNYEIKTPSVHVEQENGGEIHATIDVGGIITTAIGASVSMVISKILNRFWPDKKKK